jgi:quercetin dioxygenase-like cupin family protein
MLNELARNALAALGSDLGRRAAAEPGLAAFAAALEKVECGQARFERPTPLDHATLAYLAPAMAAMEGVAGVLAAVRAVAPAVNWYQIYQGAGVDPALAEGMLAAQIAGMSGIVESGATRAGLFLLAPGIHYPLHTHGANEVYYCLSGSLTLQHGLGGAPFELTPGKLSNTPPHRLHSLTTGKRPVLMLYAWIGEVDSPNWWWEQDGNGGWTRARWSRNPDGSWAKTGAEPVTDAHRAEAGA